MTRSLTGLDTDYLQNRAIANGSIAKQTAPAMYTHVTIDHGYGPSANNTAMNAKTAEKTNAIANASAGTGMRLDKPKFLSRRRERRSLA